MTDIADSSGFDDVISGFVSEMEQLLRRFYWQELVGLDENDRPRAGGFTGIRGIFDEVPEFLPWSQRPNQFTPSEFKVFWDNYTEYQKINYVLSLIT